MKIMIRRNSKRAVLKITAETKQDQRILAEAIKKGLGIKKGDAQ